MYIYATYSCIFICIHRFKCNTKQKTNKVGQTWVQMGGGIEWYEKEKCSFYVVLGWRNWYLFYCFFRVRDGVPEKKFHKRGMQNSLFRQSSSYRPQRERFESSNYLKTLPDVFFLTFTPIWRVFVPEKHDTQLFSETSPYNQRECKTIRWLIGYKRIYFRFPSLRRQSILRTSNFTVEIMWIHHPLYSSVKQFRGKTFPTKHLICLTLWKVQILFICSFLLTLVRFA